MPFLRATSACEQQVAGGTPLPVWCGSLRSAGPDLLATLATADVLIVTVLAAGGSAAALAQAGGDDDAWNAGAIAGLDIPVLQALCLTTPRADWAAGDGGLSPLDAATQVAIPEFDGRLISVPFSFKETGEDGLSARLLSASVDARNKSRHGGTINAASGVSPVHYVCLKKRVALSQRSFSWVSGLRLDQARMLSIEFGNWHSECG